MNLMILLLINGLAVNWSTNHAIQLHFHWWRTINGSMKLIKDICEPRIDRLHRRFFSFTGSSFMHRFVNDAHRMMDPFDGNNVATLFDSFETNRWTGTIGSSTKRKIRFVINVRHQLTEIDAGQLMNEMKQSFHSMVQCVDQPTDKPLINNEIEPWKEQWNTLGL